MNTALDFKQAKLGQACELPGIAYGLWLDDAAGCAYLGGADFSVHSVDLRAEKPAAVKRWTHHESYVSSLVGREGQLISAGYDGRLIWTKIDSGEKLRQIDAHAGWVRKLVLSTDGARLISVGDDMRACMWDAATGQLVRAFEGHARQTPEGFATALYAVAASQDGRFIAAADRTGEVLIWEVDSGKVVARFRAAAFYTYDAAKRARSIGGIRSLVFSPDGSRLILGGIGQVTNVDGFVGPCRLEAWDWQAAKATWSAQDKHQAIFNHVQFMPGSTDTLLAVGGGDGGAIVAFWKLGEEAPLHKAKPKGHVQHAALTSDNRLLLAGFGGLQIWVFGV